MQKKLLQASALILLMVGFASTQKASAFCVCVKDSPQGTGNYCVPACQGIPVEQTARCKQCCKQNGYPVNGWTQKNPFDC